MTLAGPGQPAKQFQTAQAVCQKRSCLFGPDAAPSAAAREGAQALKQQLPRTPSEEQSARGSRLLSKTKEMLLVLRQ